ncbi:bifunctional phosphoribosylaminoimidazolecarboxamide formyltransferase/IMP cyclohydrolase [Pengzhenrongella sicca]|uniref:Bifunctional purine biosynthesis protein PurH n=1 Tax=Pengzhenrongella sicca TaxID=2819238 RepID=A0A8A4ZHH1_9MICO|nr:bifunctional phosphoribosylaminoimidazolecarboxamide formyltransferase/IMP cyclohydrolase [Pengzhenrongella sicca]QTE29976.1 bifunctional phosphoribosylaminoimidazolecarboxamide formyltransferase/IMP cyclohydrolase [Pengzhenrongella sicca]
MSTAPRTTPAESTTGVDATADSTRRPLRRALVSVYDKTGLVGLATALHAAGVELVSTGSTAKTIAAAGIPVTAVEELTGFPECLDGRVKTLHPRVHAGILADTRRPEHLAQLADLGIAAFELVVVNLYPFTATVASGATPDECVEQIDIGGPSMVRAAAKNHPSVAVVVEPAQYPAVVAAAAGGADGGFTLAERRALAAAAFVHTATYDVAVASWFTNVLAPVAAGTDPDADADAGAPVASPLPSWAGATWERAAVLRYGENPHQAAALYAQGDGTIGLAQATQLHGKEMSYNNYVDADAAWRAAHDHTGPAVAIIKHANPCGIAVGADIAQAHARAHACDPLSAFGGVIAANEIVTAAMAAQVAPVFTEVVVAPGFEPAAIEILTAKKNIRLLVVAAAPRAAAEIRAISGGLLMQQADRIDAPGDDPAAWQLVAGAPADAATLADLAFAWRAVRAVKSNAILLASGGASVGVGMGQVNRVDSCKLAVERAGTGDDGRARGSVAASDAFFPFADGLQVLLDAGVRAVVQPGGSVRDAEVIAAAEAAGATLYLTGTRHFAH